MRILSAMHSSLLVGGLPASRLIAKYGSPLYVYEAGVIEERCRELRRSFPGIGIHYAMKANPNWRIVKLIHKEGIGVETVSPGEIALALKAGVPKDAITFTTAGASAAELRSVARARVFPYLDSLGQLEAWGSLKLGGPVGIRVNQGIGAGHHAHVITGGPRSKFGVDLAHLPTAIRLSKKLGLVITGIHQHIGSNVLDENVYLKAAEAIFDTASRLPDLSRIEIGGGIGIPYRPGEARMDLSLLGKKIRNRFSQFTSAYGRPIRLEMEPGRYFVAEAGTLLVTVTDVKRNPSRTFVLTDSGFNHLIRPAMYDAYHDIVNASRKKGSTAVVTIGGNICESGDVFAKDRRIVLPKMGEVLAIRNAGAYGYAMASTYNSRPLPAEVLVAKGRPSLIRSSIFPA